MTITKTCYVFLQGDGTYMYIRLAANTLAERLGLPLPGCVDSLLDTAAWRTGVRSQTAVSLSVSEQGHDDSDGSDFGSNSDRWF